MGFLPGLDVDLSKLSLDDLEALKRLLQSELALSKVRQAHIEGLLVRVEKDIKAKKKK